MLIMQPRVKLTLNHFNMDHHNVQKCIDYVKTYCALKLLLIYFTISVYKCFTENTFEAFSMCLESCHGISIATTL